jgi:hypothetical protein
VYLHIVAFAMLFGGFLAQYVARDFRVTVLMRAGLGGMIATGLLLAIPFPAGTDLNYIKLGVKLAVAIAIGVTFGFAVVAARRGKAVSHTHFATIGILTLLNAGIAVLWQLTENYAPGITGLQPAHPLAPRDLVSVESQDVRDEQSRYVGDTSS